MLTKSIPSSLGMFKQAELNNVSKEGGRVFAQRGNIVGSLRYWFKGSVSLHSVYLLIV